MSNNPAYHPLFQQADSALNIFRPSVEVPGEIKLNVSRPAIQSLKDSTSNPGRLTAPPAPESPAIAREPVPREDIVVQPSPIDSLAPDTLDHVLIQHWQISGYHKELWASPGNNPVSELPPRYFVNPDAPEPNQTNRADAQNNDESFFVDDSLIREDSIIGGEKTVRRVEEIEIGDPSVLNSKSYEEPLRSQDWFLAVIISLVALTGLVRLKWQKYLNDIFNAVVFSNVANKLQTTTTGSKKLGSFWLGFLFYANFSLLLFETMRISNRSFFNLSGWKLLITLMAFLFIIFSLKLAVYHFVGWVFKAQKATSGYLFQSSVTSKAFGIILMPLVVLFPFLEAGAQNWIPRIGLTIFILLYALQIGRGVSANLRNTLSGYYIILYLCALEILPLSILYKVLFY